MTKLESGREGLRTLITSSCETPLFLPGHAGTSLADAPTQRRTNVIGRRTAVVHDLQLYAPPGRDAVNGQL